MPKQPDHLLQFHDGKTLEVNGCSPAFFDHGILLEGKEESFFIPYGSIQYMRSKKP